MCWTWLLTVVSATLSSSALSRSRAPFAIDQHLPFTKRERGLVSSRVSMLGIRLEVGQRLGCHRARHRQRPCSWKSRSALTRAAEPKFLFRKPTAPERMASKRSRSTVETVSITTGSCGSAVGVRGIDAAEVRQVDVHQHQVEVVRTQQFGVANGFSACFRFGHQPQVRPAAQHVAQPLPKSGSLIHEENAQRRWCAHTDDSGADSGVARPGSWCRAPAGTRG
jgi:hypothetical protein